MALEERSKLHNENMRIRKRELSSIAGSAIKLAENVEGGDEADEAEAHDENDGR